jgi:3-hydroxyisobutyrate dehydrogenase-like beta-hydroxyacid dehydrogenase
LKIAEGDEMADAGGRRIGVIGTGRMGGPMAGRLLDAGHSLVVFDTNEAAVGPLGARGATIARSALEVANLADVVMASLPTPAIVRRSIIGPDGAMHGTRMRQFIDLSSSGAVATTEIAAALAPRGIEFLDAPVSGGVAGARAGKLTVMASGPRATYDELQPLLAVFGRVLFVGEKPGLAQTLKLINNLMSATAVAITSEAMVMGVKAGLDPSVMLDVINTSSGRNSATQDKFPKHVLTRGFDFGFSAGLSFKDVRLCLEEAEALGVPMMVGSVVRQMLSITCNAYGFDTDCTSTARIVEGWGGCEIAAQPANPGEKR